MYCRRDLISTIKTVEWNNLNATNCFFFIVNSKEICQNFFFQIPSKNDYFPLINEEKKKKVQNKFWAYKNSVQMNETNYIENACFHSTYILRSLFSSLVMLGFYDFFAFYDYPKKIALSLCVHTGNSLHANYERMNSKKCTELASMVEKQWLYGMETKWQHWIYYSSELALHQRKWPNYRADATTMKFTWYRRKKNTHTFFFRWTDEYMKCCYLVDRNSSKSSKLIIQIQWKIILYKRQENSKEKKM